MTFPTNPTNGQQATVNGVVYTYASPPGVWNVTTNFTGNILVDQIDANTLNTTGAITSGGSITANSASGRTSLGLDAGGSFSLGFPTNTSSTTTPYIDFNTSATAVDYDVRIQASGNTGTQGAGNLTITAGNTIATGTLTGGNISTAGNVTGNIVIGFSKPTAGTTSTAPLLFTAGNLLTDASAGAIEYDTNAFYATENTTAGRGEIGVFNQFRLDANSANIGNAIADFFGSTSSINLEAGSYYDIEAQVWFLKNTAGTVTWTWTNSSAATLVRSYYIGTVATGFTTSIVTGAPITGYAIQQTSTALAHAATASLTGAVNHHFHFKLHVITNLATNLRLRITQSAGTVTPLAGSYYWVRKISANAGNFAA